MKTAATENDAALWLLSNPLQWDVALIEYQLAQGNGVRVLAACRVRGPGRHAAMLTAHSTGELHRRCFDLNADAVLDKLDGFEPLLAKLKAWSATVETFSMSSRGLNRPGSASRVFDFNAFQRRL